MQVFLGVRHAFYEPLGTSVWEAKCRKEQRPFTKGTTIFILLEITQFIITTRVPKTIFTYLV